MKKKKYPHSFFISLISSLLISTSLFADSWDSSFISDYNSNVDTLQGIRVKVKKTGEDVILRWAPEDQNIWLQSRSGFVRIERYAFNSFANYQNGHREVLVEKLSPWSIEQFEEVIDDLPDEHPYIMAGHLVHGEWESIDTTKESLEMSDIIQRYEETGQRYSMSLVVADLYPEAADAMGWRYVDKNVPDSNYLSYSVYLYIDGIPTYQDASLYMKGREISATPYIEWTEEMEGSVKLSWDRESHERFFTAYYIERSADGKNFERINDLPFISGIDERETFGIPDIHYTIEVENYVPFYYRIIGVDLFGLESEPSNIVRLTARDRTPPPTPDRVEAFMPNERYMLIQWEQDSIAPDLLGYFVKRTPDGEIAPKKISELLPVDTRTFIDENPHPVFDNYYVVCAVDTAMNEACAALKYGFIQDTFPPAQPIGLHGEIDSQGVVTLTWEWGPELDIRGYNIYFSNRFNGVFSIINSTPVSDTIYTDTITLNSLTPEVFYRIAAVDRSGNISDFSDMIMVMRPDTIPPGSAIFTNYKNTAEGILLEWEPSGSRDVVSHHLYRKKENQDFKLIGEFFFGDESKYLDTMLEGFVTYTYKIIAIDAANLRSESVSELSIRTGNRTVIPELILSLQEEDGALFIDYHLSDNEVNLRRVILFKSVNDGPFLTWRTIENPDFTRLEDRIDKKASYTYKAMAITESGVKTNFSQEKRFHYEVD